jgi:hypothetical protein
MCTVTWYISGHMTQLDRTPQQISHIWNTYNSSKLHEHRKCARGIKLDIIKELIWCFSIYLNQILSTQRWRQQVPPKCWNKHITMWKSNNPKTIISAIPTMKTKMLISKGLTSTTNAEYFCMYTHGHHWYSLLWKTHIIWGSTNELYHFHLLIWGNRARYNI